MSRYHPIDVRHPSNRAYRKRNFLLEPPARDLETIMTPVTMQGGQASDPGASRIASRPARSSSRSSAAAAPWGSSTSSSSSNSGSAQTTRRSGGSLFFKLIRWGIFVGVIIAMFGRQLEGPFNELLLQIRIALWNIGIDLPF